jgi:purine-binding chemotaxis protein CheW
MTSNQEQINKQSINSEDYWDEEDEDTLINRYLTFHVGVEEFGIEILYVKEIIGMQKITEVPDLLDFVKGVINLRGQVIPLIDVRARFHMPDREYDDRTCIIVVEVNNMLLGLVVDRVNEVTEIPETDVSPPPKLTMSKQHEYIKGMAKVGEVVKLILDIDKLFFEDEVQQILGMKKRGV